MTPFNPRFDYFKKKNRGQLLPTASGLVLTSLQWRCIVSYTWLNRVSFDWPSRVVPENLDKVIASLRNRLKTNMNSFVGGTLTRNRAPSVDSRKVACRTILGFDGSIFLASNSSSCQITTLQIGMWNALEDLYNICIWGCIRSERPRRCRWYEPTCFPGRVIFFLGVLAWRHISGSRGIKCHFFCASYCSQITHILALLSVQLISFFPMLSRVQNCA